MCQSPATAMATNHTSMIGPNNAATLRGAARLHGEQRDQDDDGERHDVGLEGRRRDLQALDRRQHRDRRRDDRIAVEQRGADDAEQDEARRAAPSARWASAISASVPPSPLLSARSRMTTYLSVTMTISAQRISDSTPSTTVARRRPPARPRPATLRGSA